MRAKELCDEIRSFRRANADEAVVKKYSRYFKEGYDAYGLSREKLEEKVNSILSDKSVDMKLVLAQTAQADPKFNASPTFTTPFGTDWTLPLGYRGRMTTMTVQCRNMGL